MSNLRIGQITDLHLRHHQPSSSDDLKRRSRDMVELLPLALERFKQEQIDFLVVTGDLLDVPSDIASVHDYYPNPYDGWELHVREDYHLIKRLLDASEIPYAVLPGNHDSDRILHDVFASQPTVLDLEHGFKIVSFYDREWAAHVPRRVDRERRLMETVLADKSKLPQIHLQHYVIHPDCTARYPHNYYEALELKQKIVDSGRVLLSLSGHYHAGSELIKIGETYFSTSPAFAEFPHPVRIYDIVEGVVSQREIPLAERPLTDQKPCAFLDRDGVINAQASYSTGPQELTLVPGSAEAIVKLHDAGFVVVVVTSQSCVGAGFVTTAVLTQVHDRLCDLLVQASGGDRTAQPDLIIASHGAGDDAVHPRWLDISNAKPSATLLENAQALLGLAEEGAWMVGDRLTDYQAALNYGARFVLVRTGRGADAEAQLTKDGTNDVIIVDSLSDAVPYILGER
jgi:D-glycero-D-manno-heptose 1,7-bisphosphate phosphatase